MTARGTASRARSRAGRGEASSGETHPFRREDRSPRREILLGKLGACRSTREARRREGEGTDGASASGRRSRARSEAAVASTRGADAGARARRSGAPLGSFVTGSSLVASAAIASVARGLFDDSKCLRQSLVPFSDAPRRGALDARGRERRRRATRSASFARVRCEPARRGVDVPLARVRSARRRRERSDVDARFDFARARATGGNEETA